MKEQLKIMAGVEFIDVNLGYIDVENPAENHVVYVPELSKSTLVPDGPLQVGHVFAVGHSVEGEMAIYKLENKAVAGDLKLETEGLGYNRAVNDGIEAAFKYFGNNANKVALGVRAGAYDYLMFFNDLQKKGLSAEISLAEFVGLCSAACGRPVAASLVIPGILRMSGSMDELRDLEDIFRVAKNAGAKKILLPMSSLAQLQTVPQELMSSVSPDFYPDGDAVSAARKALEI